VTSVQSILTYHSQEFQYHMTRPSTGTIIGNVNTNRYILCYIWLRCSKTAGNDSVLYLSHIMLASLLSNALLMALIASINLFSCIRRYWMKFYYNMPSSNDIIIHSVNSITSLHAMPSYTISNTTWRRPWRFYWCKYFSSPAIGTSTYLNHSRRKFNMTWRVLPPALLIGNVNASDASRGQQILCHLPTEESFSTWPWVELRVQSL